MTKQRYRVILMRKGKHILTPGELSIQEAKKKASYLSQYGTVSIVDAQQLGDGDVKGSPKVRAGVL